jgi:hypothetical protein
LSPNAAWIYFNFKEVWSQEFHQMKTIMQREHPQK